MLLTVGGIKAQNNPIFGGGSGDGWTMAIFAQVGNNIYGGGVGDGWTMGSASGSLLTVDVFDASNFKVYPNPTSGLLNIHFGATRENASIEVRNVTGQNVLSKRYNAVENIEVDLSAFQAGLYLIDVEADECVAAVKILKK